jgi:hypothetical protein
MKSAADDARDVLGWRSGYHADHDNGRAALVVMVRFGAIRRLTQGRDRRM